MRRSFAIPSVALVALAALAGCGDPCNPLGTYATVFAWEGGDCGLTMPEQKTFSVNRDQRGGFNIVGGNGNITSGEVFGCTLSFTLDEPQRGRHYSINIEEVEDSRLTGSGVVEIRSELGLCNQAFFVTGERR